MLTYTNAFSSFSTNDLENTTLFYRDTLGLKVEEMTEMGLLILHLAGDQTVMIYPKNEGHTPATFTVLNFQVDDIESSVDELTGKRVVFEQYKDEYIKTDEKGISRGHGRAM